MHLSTLAASALLSVTALPLQAQLPAQQQAAEKQAAFVAQTASAALLQDIALLSRLDAPFPKPTSFTGTPAGEVLKAIRAASKVSIELDGRALGEASAWEIKAVTCEPATMRQALEAVVRAITPGYTDLHIDVAAGIVVLTDDEGLSRLKAPAQYPLAVTLSRLGASETDAPALELAMAELEEFLAVTYPDAWESRGGGIARVVWTGSVATVEAPPGFHHDIRRRLSTLEAALPGINLLWSVQVADVTGASDADLGDALAQPAALERLAKDGHAKTLASPRLLAKSTEPAEIRLGDGTEELLVRIEPVAGSKGQVFIARIEAGAGERRGAVVLRVVPGVRAAVAFDAGGRRLAVEVHGLTELAQKLLKR